MRSREKADVVGSSVTQKGKTRISIFIDNTVLDEFRARAEKAGTGYQTMINEVLRKHLSDSEPPLTEKALRQVLRQEMPEYFKGSPIAGGRARRKLRK